MTLEEKAKQAWSNNAKKYGGLDSSYIEGYEHALEDFKSALRAEIEKEISRQINLQLTTDFGTEKYFKVSGTLAGLHTVKNLLDTVTPKQ